MSKRESYAIVALAYVDGVRTLFAPSGPPTKERGGVQGPTSYEDLAKKAEGLSGVSDDLGKMIAGQLSAPDPDLRMEGATRMLAKALADLEVSTYLLQAAMDEEQSAPFEEGRGAERTVADIGVTVEYLDILLGDGRAIRRVVKRAGKPANTNEARATLFTSLDDALTLISERAVGTAKSAIEGLGGLGAGELAQAAGTLGMSIAGILGQAEKVSRLFDLFRHFVSKVYDALAALVGESLIQKAGQKVLEWVNESKGGRYFPETIEALYQTKLTKEDLNKFVADSKASLDEFATAIQAVDCLKEGYGNQVKLVEKLIKGLKFIGSLSDAILPHGKLILAAAHIALGGYVILAGADYVDSPNIKWLDRVIGVRRVVKGSLKVSGEVIGIKIDEMTRARVKVEGKIKAVGKGPKVRGIQIDVLSGSKNYAPQDVGAKEEARKEIEFASRREPDSGEEHQPLIEEKIRLDVHTPETVEVQKTFEIGVAIRQPESPLPEEPGMPKVASKGGRVFREKSEDIVRYRVKVSAPDCDVHTDETVFLLRAGTASETHYFQLTARKAGLVSILVQAYQEDGILAADTRVSVTATLEAKPVEVRPMGNIRYKNLDLELFDYQNDYQMRARHTEYFRVRVIDSPSGQQKPSDAEKVTLPADVRRRLQMLQDRSLTLSERIERGEMLANLLFPPRARWYLDHSRPDDDERLRIRIRFDNYSLVDLPWEFAYIAKPDTPPGQKGADGFLVLDRKISLVRFEIMGQAMVSVDPVGQGPLRMAILMANPDDPGLTKLNLEAEQKSMEEVLKEIPIIHPKFCPNATLEKLEDALTGDLHAFHFAGHGGFEGDLGVTFGSQEGKGFIVLEDQNHRPFKFPAEKLALNLAGRGVRLAVLGSCEGGRRDQVNAWTGVAPALTRAGIPAVVGMQFKVLDENAIAFSRKFYRALAAGESVDAAVTDGRLAIFNRGGDEERDWAVPVLYLRAEEGVLFPTAEASAVLSKEKPSSPGDSSSPHYS